MLNKYDQIWDAMTQAGHPIWYQYPERTPIDTADLKFASANICRYNGHLRWMLIRHLALCVKLAEYILDKEHFTLGNLAEFNYLRTITTYLKRTAVDIIFTKIWLKAACGGHDLHEVYVMDVPSGLKQYLPDYRQYEDNWEHYVLTTFKINYKENLLAKSFVKSIDMLALCLEMKYFDWPDTARVTEDMKVKYTSEEVSIIDSIAKMSLDDCWIIVEEALNKNLNQQGNNGKTRN